MLIAIVTVAVGFLVAAAVAYVRRKHQYWRRRGVPYIPPSMPFGNFQNRFRQKLPNYEVIKGQYEHFRRRGVAHGGLYLITSHIWFPVDPDLIRCVVTKDFAHFTSHGLYYDEKNDPLSAHLFSLEGHKWRTTRAKLTPTFTSGKMRRMFDIVARCGEQLKEHVASSTNSAVDVKDALASYTMDVIGSCAFGVDCNSFKEPLSPFRENGRKLFVASFRRTFRLFCIAGFPKLSKWLGLTIFERELTHFYMEAVKDMVAQREGNGARRDDYLQLLLDLKGREGGLTQDELAAQAFGFIIAGFETSSTALTFCLFELALNPDVQEKLRWEINDLLDMEGGDEYKEEGVEGKGRLSYEGVMSLKYMGQVIDETLRKYPPLPTLLRKCVEDYKVPGTDVTVEKGKRVFVSVLGLHYDPAYYPEPERFDPDRFSEEKRAKRRAFTYLPFGEGPRMCLGARFAMMQIRVGLVLLLGSYRLKVSSKTQLPLKMDPHNFLMMPLHKIWLDFERIK